MFKFIKNMFRKPDILTENQIYSSNSKKLYRLITNVNTLSDHYEYTLLNKYGRVKSVEQKGSKKHLESNFTKIHHKKLPFTVCIK